MEKKTSSVVLATVLSLGGLTTGLVVAPAMASAATTQATTTQAVSDRLTRIKEALGGLVSDGTLSQEQADRVATTLGQALPQRGGPDGHGGPGGGGHRGGPGSLGGGQALDTAATTLGVTEDELRTALRDGQSLADVAESQGVAVDALVAVLVEQARAHLAEEVTEGDLTQTQADERAARMEERVTALVEREGLGRHGRGAPPADVPPAEVPAD